ncbi:MAG: ABC transporter ATP-binding protein [Mycoplasmataceae bacterium]|jgi:ABC-2 type transport system ATP-binding protein|nr:ABC transporter ATP-binding protein [Mycoplasmataceae bacterium]
MSGNLKVKNLSITLNKTPILKDVSFEVAPGSVCAFIGANGAGKTTTIKSIVGLYPYENGTILINDVDAKTPESHVKLGYVPEKENFPKISGRRFLNQCVEYFHLSPTDRDNMISKLLQLFGISDIVDRKLPKMSSGQKKKFLIIQALIHNPDLLIMDEPTENMDPDARLSFYEIVAALKSQGKTLFISTHNLDEIQKYATHVVIIKAGEIKYTGAVDKDNLFTIYEQYTDNVKVSSTDIKADLTQPENTTVKAADIFK